MKRRVLKVASSRVVYVSDLISLADVEEKLASFERLCASSDPLLRPAGI